MIVMYKFGQVRKKLYSLYLKKKTDYKNSNRYSYVIYKSQIYYVLRNSWMTMLVKIIIKGTSVNIIVVTTDLQQIMQ